MAWAEVTAIAIYPSALFDLHSDCGAWALRVQRRFTNAAQQFAPFRSGELREGISGYTTRTGPVHVTSTISSSAPHTMYVLKGTDSPIMARRLWGFRGRTGLQYPRGTYVMYRGAQFGLEKPLRERGYLLNVRAGSGHPQRYAEEVSGQNANNFFLAAAQETAFRHPSLAGWAPGVGDI